MNLNENELAALEAVRNGVDVYSLTLAKTLRAIERKQKTENKNIVWIGPAQAYEGDGTDQTPYFGAILLGDGEQLLEVYQ